MKRYIYIVGVILIALMASCSAVPNYRGKKPASSSYSQGKYRQHIYNTKSTVRGNYSRKYK